MNCEELKDLRHAYADRELDEARTMEVEGHLRDCAVCSQAQERIRTLGTRLKSPDLYFKAPTQFKQRMLDLVAANLTRETSPQSGTAGISPARSRSKDDAVVTPAPPGATARNFWGNLRNILKFAVAVAGTAVVAFVVAAAFIGRSADERVAQELTASHVRSLMAAHLTDVASSDQHAVKPWFAGKIDFAPPVKDLAAQGFPLVGGRLDYLQDREVAALVYQRQNHYINLFIWPAKENSSEKRVVRRGYNLIRWTGSGMTFWAVSDLNPAELQTFEKLIKQ